MIAAWPWSYHGNEAVMDHEFDPSSDNKHDVHYNMCDVDKNDDKHENTSNNDNNEGGRKTGAELQTENKHKGRMKKVENAKNATS